MLVDNVLDDDPLNLEVALPLLRFPPVLERLLLVTAEQFGDTHELAAFHHTEKQENWFIALLGFLEPHVQSVIVLLAGGPETVLDGL
jgi:hypothetical protein